MPPVGGRHAAHFLRYYWPQCPTWPLHPGSGLLKPRGHIEHAGSPVHVANESLILPAAVALATCHIIDVHC